MFEQAEELVGRPHVRGVVAPDITAVGERAQRFDGVGHAQRFVDATVHELEQLHGELDVAEAAASELEFAFA